MKQLLKDKRNIVIILLGVLFLLEAAQKDIRLVFWVVAGVFLCAAADVFLNRTLRKTWIFPKSGIITGFIFTGVLDYNQPWFFLVLLSLTAILSKYIIKYKKHHIFNPANFALFVAVLLKLPLTWHIAVNNVIIIIAGIYFAYSLKKIPHIIGFFVFFSVFFMIEKINPLLFISWFFVFVMLIEPKTSGYGRIRGFIFGSICGISSFLIYKLIPHIDMLVAALFIANCFNPVLEKIRRDR